MLFYKYINTVPQRKRNCLIVFNEHLNVNIPKASKKVNLRWQSFEAGAPLELIFMNKVEFSAV